MSQEWTGTIEVNFKEGSTPLSMIPEELETGLYTGTIVKVELGEKAKDTGTIRWLTLRMLVKFPAEMAGREAHVMVGLPGNRGLSKNGKDLDELAEREVRRAIAACHGAEQERKIKPNAQTKLSAKSFLKKDVQFHYEKSNPAMGWTFGNATLVTAEDAAKIRSGELVPQARHITPNPKPTPARGKAAAAAQSESFGSYTEGATAAGDSEAEEGGGDALSDFLS